MANLHVFVLLLVLARTILCGSAVNLTYLAPSSSNNSNTLSVQDNEFFLCMRQGNCGQMRFKKHKQCRKNPNFCKKYSRHHTCCFFHRVCIDLSANLLNCRFCGHICKHGTRCCNGACVDINRNKHHCGKCRNACLPDESCAYGICGYA